MKVQTKNLKLSKTQKELYKAAKDDSCLFVVGNISRQQGKSVLCKLLSIEWLCQNGNFISYITPTFKLANKFYQDIIKILPKNLIKNKNGTKLMIESISGSILQFHSIEAIETLRGYTNTHIIGDEVGSWREYTSDGQDVWNDIILPTMKVKGKKYIFISTPKGKTGLFWNLYQNSLTNEKYKYIHKTVYDDAFITPEQIEELKTSMPQMSFKQEFMCEFLDSALTYFIGFEECKKDYDFNFNTKLWCSIDFSGSGTDATVLTLINELNQIKQYTLKGNYDVRYDEIAKILNNNKTNITGGYMENNGVGDPMINEIRKKLYQNLSTKIKDFTTTNETKNDYIQSLALAIQKKEFWFNTKELEEQFGYFIYKLTKTRKLTYGAKEGKHDDLVIGAALAHYAKENIKSNTTNPIAFISR